jgi:hypothetical protein
LQIVREMGRGEGEQTVRCRRSVEMSCTVMIRNGRVDATCHHFAIGFHQSIPKIFLTVNIRSIGPAKRAMFSRFVWFNQ